MNSRTRRKTVTFGKPFSLKAIGRLLPAGAYEVITDEELIEGLSFPVYRRVATMMLLPTGDRVSSMAMMAVDPQDLARALERDTSVAVADAPPGKAR